MFFSKKTTGGPVEWLIVGLGNPGRQYENTRHNAGFMALDGIAREYGAQIKRLKFKAVVGEAEISGKRCLLMKPDTFMNLSGQAVVEAMNFYKVPIERVVVLCDDISLEPGRLRIRRKGSDGGHNGLKNILYLTGKDSFPRIRLGVGKKPHPDYDLADWVTGKFSPEDRKTVDEAVKRAADAIECIMDLGLMRGMGKFNQ